MKYVETCNFILNHIVPNMLLLFFFFFPASSNRILLPKQPRFLDFPGGPVVKNPPAHVGDTGLIPGWERFHMLQSN